MKRLLFQEKFMNRLQFCALAAMILVISPGKAATNPFAEGQIKIERSASESNAASGDKIAEAGAAQISKADLDAAIQKLREANDKYSELLKEFAADPEKFGDEKGDYRPFIKQLELMSKRLYEISKRLEEISEKMDAGKADETQENKPVAIEGTVRVNTSLNVRTGPWGSIIGNLHNNDRVKIIGQDGDWYKIDYNGRTAFVHANYVNTPNKNAGNTPVNKPSDSSSDATTVPTSQSNATGGGLTAAPCSPMPGYVSSEFGYRTHPTLGYRKMHNGVDLPIPNGTRLNALGNGTVTAVGYESGGGRYVKVRYDNGYESFYCHLKSYSVKKGQRVNAGDEIARSDNTGEWTTGPHLHFGLKKNGQWVSPRSAGVKLP